MALVGVLATRVAATETPTFTYDALGRLIKVDRVGTANNGVSSSYTYDRADNRTNVTVTGAAPQIPTFSVDDVAVDEGGTLTFTIRKLGTASGPLTVDYATTDGTATAGSDYTAASGTLNFAAGDTSLTVNVPSSDDATVESDETFALNLSNAAAGSVIGDPQGLGTLRNNDVPPGFSINDATATEGGILAFTVTRSGPTSGSLTVDFATADGSATAASDYTASSGTLTFDPGVTSLPINVPTIDDGASEGSETLSVILGNPSGGAIINDGQGVGTIADNDVPQLSINDVSVVEGGTLTFTISLSGPSSTNVTVNETTANGTAVSTGPDSDYTARSGLITFTPGQTAQVVTISTNDEARKEADETMFVNLSGATGATISDAQGVGTIIDDDSRP